MQKRFFLLTILLLSNTWGAQPTEDGYDWSVADKTHRFAFMGAVQKYAQSLERKRTVPRLQWHCMSLDPIDIANIAADMINAERKFCFISAHIYSHPRLYAQDINAEASTPPSYARQWLFNTLHTVTQYKHSTPVLVELLLAACVSLFDTDKLQNSKQFSVLLSYYTKFPTAIFYPANDANAHLDMPKFSSFTNKYQPILSAIHAYLPDPVYAPVAIMLYICKTQESMGGTTLFRPELGGAYSILKQCLRKNGPDPIASCNFLRQLASQKEDRIIIDLPASIPPTPEQSFLEESLEHAESIYRRYCSDEDPLLEKTLRLSRETKLADAKIREELEKKRRLASQPPDNDGCLKACIACLGAYLFSRKRNAQPHTHSE